MSEKRFKDQVAIIIGGARGIGLGIGKRLGQEGAQILLIDVLEAELKETTILLQSKNVDVAYAMADIQDETRIQELFHDWAERFGRIDILVNCAGIVGPTNCKITSYALDEFKSVIGVNLIGAFIATRAVIPHMEQGNYGRILHLTSIGGKEGNPGMAGYAASKSGLMGLVKGIGKEYAGTGITVNGLAPAVIATKMNEDTNPETLQYMISKIPMGRLGKVEEVASLAAWIVSPEASFNTGFVFDISGGRATY